MKTIQEQIEVMQHYANNGMVEIFSAGTNTWNLISNPDWDWRSQDYRIKEQKKTINIEKWLYKNKDNEHFVFEGCQLYISHIRYEKIKLLESYEVEL